MDRPDSHGAPSATVPRPMPTAATSTHGARLVCSTGVLRQTTMVKQAANRPRPVRAATWRGSDQWLCRTVAIGRDRKIRKTRLTTRARRPRLGPQSSRKMSEYAVRARSSASRTGRARREALVTGETMGPRIPRRSGADQCGPRVPYMTSVMPRLASAWSALAVGGEVVAPDLVDAGVEL